MPPSAKPGCEGSAARSPIRNSTRAAWRASIGTEPPGAKPAGSASLCQSQSGPCEWRFQPCPICWPEVEFLGAAGHSGIDDTRACPDHQIGRIDMLFPGGFTFPNFLADVFSIFIFVLWFWLLITVFGDLFRRRDVSGLGKVVWVIVLVVFPYLGVFIYLISQHRGMAERQNQRAQQARDELRQVDGFSVADELEKLERLKNSNRISNEEYTRLRARVVQ